MSALFPQPRLGRDCYVAPTAYVGGDVVLGDQCTVMHHAVIRGDVSRIRIGHRVNVQDAVVIHTNAGTDLDIGSDVGMGHQAIVHCRRVGDRTLIGIGSIVLDDAEIGSDCIVGAGSLVPPRMKVPDGHLVLGSPARVLRELTEKDREYIRHVVESYIELRRRHREGAYTNVAATYLDRT